MKKITIEGTFTGSVNKFVIVDVFRPNGFPDPYNFSKTYHGSFKETLKDLKPDTTYNIDISGFTTGEFDVKITGEFEGTNPITDHFVEGSFNPGYVIHTKH
jgi:hypothetical protein